LAKADHWLGSVCLTKGVDKSVRHWGFGGTQSGGQAKARHG